MKILSIVGLFLSINLTLTVQVTEDNFSLKDLLDDSQHTIINIFKSDSKPEIKNNIYEKNFAPVIKIDEIKRLKKSDTFSTDKDPHFDDPSDELESDDDYLDSILNEKEDEVKPEPPTSGKGTDGYAIDQIKNNEGNSNSISRIINIYESGSNPKIKNNFYEKDFAPFIKISDAKKLSQQIGLRQNSNGPIYQNARGNLNPESKFAPYVYRSPTSGSDYRVDPSDFRSHPLGYPPYMAYKSNAPESRSPLVAYNQVNMGGFSYGPQNATNSLNPESKFRQDAFAVGSPTLTSGYKPDSPEVRNPPPISRPYTPFKAEPEIPSSLNPESKSKSNIPAFRSPPVAPDYKPDSPESRSPQVAYTNKPPVNKN